MPHNFPLDPRQRAAPGACTHLSVGADHIISELFMDGSVLPVDCRLFEGKSFVLFTDESLAVRMVYI